MTATANRTTVLLDTRPARGKHRARRVRRTAVLALLALGMLVGMLMIPNGQPTASAAVSPHMPCHVHVSKLARMVCTFSDTVAVTAHAITPR